MNSESLSHDIALLKKCIGDDLISIGLFGSILKKNPTDINDIDLVLLVRNCRPIFNKLKKRLKLLSFPIDRVSINSYGGGGTVDSPVKKTKHKNQIGYDITIIDNLDGYFMRRNRTTIKFL